MLVIHRSSRNICNIVTLIYTRKGKSYQQISKNKGFIDKFQL